VSKVEKIGAGNNASGAGNKGEAKMRKTKERLLAIGLIVAALGAAQAGVKYGPCLGNVQKTQATITWVTDEEESSVIQYGTTDKLGQWVSDPAKTIFHEITLTGLKPATTYYYSLSTEDDIKTSPPKAHTIYSFHTPPATRDTSFRFIVYGDSRTDVTAHKQILRLAAKLEPDFIIHTGDIVANGTDLKDWDNFFLASSKLLSQVPFYFALGNHELDSENYFDFFALPGNERYYSFNYANCHFVCIDSSSPYLWDDRQIHWLEKDLKANRWADFTILFCHHPPFSCSSHGSSLFLRETYCPIFERYGVDVVFSGHDHSYQRSLYHNIQYIVSAGGGAPIYGIGLKRDWLVKGESVHHLVLVEVNGKKTTMRAILPGGSIFDTVTLVSKK